MKNINSTETNAPKASTFQKPKENLYVAGLLDNFIDNKLKQ